jgi:hypothetical protein
MIDPEFLQHLLAGLSHLLLPATATVALVGIPSAIALRCLAPDTFREGTILICGYIVGAIGGNSESPVAQTLLSGILGLMAGLVAYVHVREDFRTSGVRTLASLSFMTLLVALLLGLVAGAAYKRRFEPYKQARDRYNVYFKSLAIPLCLEESKLALKGTPASAPSSACEAVEEGIQVQR